MVYFNHNTTVNLRKESVFIPLCENAFNKDLSGVPQFSEGYYEEIEPDKVMLYMNPGSGAIFVLTELSEDQTSLQSTISH